MEKKRLVSGIQPSGMIHLGNYFGAMIQYLELQEEYHSFIFIANFHALNTIRDPEIMNQYVTDLVAHYLAIGLDPEKVSLYRQSDLPEVCELSWILSTLTPMGILERCHSYKDKIAKGFSPDHGLFAYPVLMAADILLPKANIVPVGKDQKQHVEVTRDIALKFNNQYGEILTIPEDRINQSTAVVPGIDGQKMSKSYDNCIYPFASEKALKKQVMNIVTDSTPLEEPKDPDKCNVFGIYKLLADQDEIEKMRNQYLAGGYGYGHAKKELLAKILDYFAVARTRYLDLHQNKDYMEEVLQKGVEKVRTVAHKTLTEVRKAVGFY
ncbi:MAG: tryptophan--tRNA ligase [Spirochaetes bacterium]|nr:tryptophan--tRNA ligase [Spirochaetota bacterium]